MSKNMVVPERPQMAIWRRVARWISKATRAYAHARAHAPTHTHTGAHEHALTRACAVTHIRTHKQVILIGIPRQQWFH